MADPGPIRFDGVASGIDYQSIIDKLVSFDTRPATLLQGQIKIDTTKEAALQELSAKLLALKGSAGLLGSTIFFDRTLVTSSNQSVLTASGDNVQSTGSFNFLVRQLAQAHQVVSSGFASNTTLLGAGNISVEFGNGFANRKTPISFLNGQTGIDRGMIKLASSAGTSVNVDLTDAVSVQDVLDRINNNGVLNVTASVSADGLSIQNGTGSTLTVSDVGGHTTATSLGISGSVAAGQTLFGNRINTVTSGTSLSLLNDGLGVRFVSGADFQVTTRSGASFQVDIDANDTTVQNVLDKINKATGNSGKVTARLNPEGNAFQLIDNTAGAGKLTVTALGNSNTAYDLGFVGVQSELNGVAGAAGSNFLLGKRVIPTLNSVLRRTLAGGSGEFQDQASTGKLDGVADGTLRIQGRTGVIADVNLASRAQTTLTTAPVFSGATNSTSFNVASTSGLAVGSQIRLVNGSNLQETVTVTGISGSTVTTAGALTNAYAIGNSALSSNQSLSDVMNSISGAPGENLSVAFNSAGNGLVITDLNAGGTSALRITDVRKGLTATGGTTTTLVDSSLIGLPTDYYKGAIVRVKSGTNAGYAGVVTGFNSSTGTLTLANAAGVAFDATSGYEIETQPNDFTTRIPSTQATGGTTTTIVAPSLQGYPTGYFVGQRVAVTSGTNAGYQGSVTAFNSSTGTLTLSTAAGVAFDATSVFRLDDTDRKTAGSALGIRTATSGTASTTGTTTTLVDGRLVGLANGSLVGTRLQITSGTNSGYVGLVTGFDGTTGTLTLANAAGAAFDNTSQYSIDAALGSSVNGAALHPQYIGDNTLLSTLNQGKGVFAGQFQVTDRNGKAFTVDLSGAGNTTIGAVILDINGGAASVGSDLRAGIDPTGNGIVLTSPTGFGQILVRDLNGGTTAHDLNIAGTGSVANPSTLDGSFQYNFAVSATDTLDSLAKTINAAGLPVVASVLNTGSAVNPYELSLLSRSSGSTGRMVFGSSVPGLSLSTSTAAQDSVLLYGATGGAGNPSVLVNSTNTVTNVVPGLTVNLQSASTSSVTVTVSKDTQGVQDQVKKFVDAYNAVIDDIKTLAKFDPNDPANKGPLFGDSSVFITQQALADSVSNPVAGISPTGLNTLSKVGIKLGQDGKLTFDSSALASAVTTNFDGVKLLFTKLRGLTNDVLLSDLNDGRGIGTVTGNDFSITQRNGNVINVGLNGLKTVGDVLGAINFNPQNTGLQVVASTTADGQSFQLVDNSSGFNGTAAGAAAGSFNDPALAGFADGFWKNQQVQFTSGPLAGQTFSVTGFTKATQTVTFNSALNPGVGSTYRLIHDFQVTPLNGSTAAANLGINLDVGNASTLTGRQIFLTKDPGVGRRFGDALGSLTDLPNGTLTLENSTLQTQVTDLQKRIDTINKRADDHRNRLIQQFAALETFLAQQQGVQSQLASGLSGFISASTNLRSSSAGVNSSTGQGA